MGTLYMFSASIVIILLIIIIIIIIIILAHANIGHAFAYITFVYGCMLYAHATIMCVGTCDYI
jgi:hypothetical protein